MWGAIILILLYSDSYIQYTFGLSSFQDVRLKREEESENCMTIEGDFGRCVPITECEDLVDLLVKNKHNETVIRHIKKSHCGFTQKYPKVCCKIFDSIEPYKHLPSECGNSVVAIKRRIAGRAPLNAWPWIALLGYEYNSTTYRWKCLGALVSLKHIVTSASCIMHNSERPTRVRVGELDIESVADGALHIEREIDVLLPHPKFDAVKKINDIGIVTLSKPVIFSVGIKPICMPFSPKLKEKNFTGFKSYIAGWGNTDISGNNRLSHQLEGTVVIRSTEECDAAYTSLKQDITIDERVVCAGGRKNEACQGDGGGPLMVEEDGLIYMIGTVSYGNQCGVDGFPGVYTRVSSYVDWIAANTH